MDKLLYYPYINVPRVDWTLRTLLYYENIASIVPNQYFNDPEGSYDPFMLELVRSELVTPVNPMAVLENPWDSMRPFVEMLARDDKQLQRSQWRFANQYTGRVHMDKFAPGTRIHPDKFDDNVLNQLLELGLARREGNWFIVEKRTANDLMTFLASVLSVKTQRLPITDYVKSGYYVSSFVSQERSKRETILSHLIPFPENIDLYKLRKFKEKHFQLLSAFRAKVEILALDEHIIEGTPLFQSHLLDLSYRKEELTAKMNEGWGFNRIIFGTVCGIIGAVGGLEQAMRTGAGGWPSAITSLASFANAIHSALQYERAENIFDQSGLKYLALAEKRLRR